MIKKNVNVRFEKPSVDIDPVHNSRVGHMYPLRSYGRWPFSTRSTHYMAAKRRRVSVWRTKPRVNGECDVPRRNGRRGYQLTNRKTPTIIGKRTDERSSEHKTGRYSPSYNRRRSYWRVDVLSTENTTRPTNSPYRSFATRDGKMKRDRRRSVIVRHWVVPAALPNVLLQKENIKIAVRPRPAQHPGTLGHETPNVRPVPSTGRQNGTSVLAQ